MKDIGRTWILSWGIMGIFAIYSEFLGLFLLCWVLMITTEFWNYHYKKYLEGKENVK